MLHQVLINGFFKFALIRILALRLRHLFVVSRMWGALLYLTGTEVVDGRVTLVCRHDTGPMCFSCLAVKLR